MPCGKFQKIIIKEGQCEDSITCKNIMVSLVAPFRCTAFQFHLTLSVTAIRSTLSPTSIRTPALSRLSSNSMSHPADLTPVLSQNDAANVESSDVLIQYVVLRRDLIDSWPLGSVVTQGCHASVSAIWSHKEDPDTVQYCSPEKIDSMHKVKPFFKMKKKRKWKQVYCPCLLILH